MLLLRDISLAFGPQVVFDTISASLSNDQKIGIVGRNGTGKSTLLKAIVGLQTLDEGSVEIDRNTTIAYMPQEVTLNSIKTVYDEAFSVFDKYTKLEQEQLSLEKKLESEPEDAEALIERYSTVLEKLSQFDRADAQKRTHEILNGLGFSDEQKKQVTDTLSVGWKMRLVLAQLLLQQADFYLFDEPTNHLDISTKEWFFNFLKQGDFGYLLVTHDRHFLEQACDFIFELERGKGTMYYGNFSTYVAQKEERRAQVQSAYERQQKEISRKKETIERFRASASKAKMAQSMMKQLDRIELIEIEPTLPTIHLTFPPVEQPGRVVLTVKNVSHSFGDKQLFTNASCEVMRGQKIALVAPNGMGKTTFFNLIAGKIPLQHGSIEFGHNVKVALFEQDQTRVLKPENTILEEVYKNVNNVSESTVRGFLGSFLFAGDDAYKKVGVLSGGERNRVAMVKVLLQKANFLILDEPTNHLDLYAKEILLQALKQYQGTILIVSHDHAFIHQLATDILELTPQGLFHYPGTYEEFLADRNQRAQEALKKMPSKAVAAHVVSKKSAASEQDLGALRKQLSKLEDQIAQLEKRQERVSLVFAEYSYGSPEFTKALAELDELKAKVATKLAEWQELEERIAAVKA